MGERGEPDPGLERSLDVPAEIARDAAALDSTWTPLVRALESLRAQSRSGGDYAVSSNAMEDINALCDSVYSAAPSPT